MQQVVAENIVAGAIQKVINDHLEAYPQVSLRGIAAREDGIGREYIRRLAAGEIPDHKIDREKVLLILMTLSKKKNLKDLGAFYGDPITSWIKSSVIVNWENDTELAERELEAMMLQDEDDCIAFLMAHTDAGATVDEVVKVVGETGKRSLPALEQRSFLVKDAGRYRGKENNFLTLSLQATQKIIQTLVGYYKPSHFGKNRNYIMLMTGSLNAEGIKAQQELYRKFHQDIRQIYENPSHSGDIHSFSVSCMDSFTMLEEANHELH
ncbi:MAG: hypothetical protein ACLGG0_03040 [Bacteriovoracia bacterium]